MMAVRSNTQNLGWSKAYRVTNLLPPPSRLREGPPGPPPIPPPLRRRPLPPFLRPTERTITMAKILVLYYSSYGHIEAMADAVAEGARAAGAAEIGRAHV